MWSKYDPCLLSRWQVSDYHPAFLISAWTHTHTQVNLMESQINDIWKKKKHWRRKRKKQTRIKQDFLFVLPCCLLPVSLSGKLSAGRVEDEPTWSSMSRFRGKKLNCWKSHHINLHISDVITNYRCVKSVNIQSSITPRGTLTCWEMLMSGSDGDMWRCFLQQCVGGWSPDSPVWCDWLTCHWL